MDERDLTRAELEATAAYKTRREAMDKQIRVARVAHTVLGKLVDGKHGDHILGALYGDMAYKTAAVARVPGAAQAVREAAERSVGLSVAAIHTDFEWACRDLLADALEFWPTTSHGLKDVTKAPASAPSVLAKRGWAGSISAHLRTHSSGEGFLSTCYSLLGLTPTEANLALLPVFDFFRRCRNRIIHQDGTAGRDLAEFAATSAFKKSFASMRLSSRKLAPSLPTPEPDELLELTPAHAILFLLVSRSLYLELASSLAPMLDADGYLRMAAHYAYGISHHPFRQSHYKSVDYPARRFLAERYRVSRPGVGTLIADYRRLGLWDAIVERYRELFPAKPQAMKAAQPFVAADGASRRR